MSKKSVIFHWIMFVLLMIAGVGGWNSDFILSNILAIICAILYLPVPPISKLWTKSKKSRIATSFTICVLLFISIVSNGFWVRHNFKMLSGDSRSFNSREESDILP